VNLMPSDGNGVIRLYVFYPKRVTPFRRNPVGSGVSVGEIAKDRHLSGRCMRRILGPETSGINKLNKAEQPGTCVAAIARQKAWEKVLSRIDVNLY
jgi:hypothetical protein